MRKKIESPMILKYLLSAIGAILIVIFFALFFKFDKLDAVPAASALSIEKEVFEEDTVYDGRDVFVPASSIKFENTRYIRLVPGGTFQISWNVFPEESIESVHWLSTNSQYVSVSQDGTIYADRQGEAFVIAETYDRAVSQRVLVMVGEMPSRILNVPYINQLRDYPNGCESCSTVMALNYAGYDIGVDEFIDEYLDMAEVPYTKNGVYSGKSPWQCFLGDPRESTGLCCYAPVIGRALEKFLPPDEYEVKEHYNVPLETLCQKYINNRIPIIFWGTISMSEPYLMNWSWHVEDGEEGEMFTWVAPMHCMLLIGYDDDYYYFNDPISGKGVSYTKADTEKAYEGLYMQAVTITPLGND